MQLYHLEERPDTERGLAKYRALDLMQIPDLSKFTIDVLNLYGTEEKLEEANKVADVVVQMLIKKNLLTENVHQSFVDVLITATMIHNIFYNPEDWTTLYHARRELMDMAKETIGAQQVIDAIFQTVEAQMGEDTPVPASKPGPNTPTELFAYAVWFVKEFKPHK